MMSILPYMDQTFAAPSVSIETSQETYHYGDHLNFMINVSEITGDIATVYITGPEGKKSPLPVGQIFQEHTEFPARNPFAADDWETGTYTLEVEYSGAKSSVQFTIEDAGKIGIPSWIKDLAKMWVTDLISGKNFSVAIEYMINTEIIKIPYIATGDDADVTSIPAWVKNNAGWWATGLIDDTEFAVALQYLIKKGIITVNLSNM